MASEKGHFSYSSKDQKRMLVTLFISVLLLCPLFGPCTVQGLFAFFLPPPYSWSKSQYLLAFLPSVSSTSLKQQWEWSIIAGLSLSLSHCIPLRTSGGKNRLVGGNSSLMAFKAWKSKDTWQLVKAEMLFCAFTYLRLHLSKGHMTSLDLLNTLFHFHFVWPCKNIHTLTHSLQRWPMKMCKRARAFDLVVNKGFFPVKQLIAQLSTKDQWIATLCSLIR